MRSMKLQIARIGLLALLTLGLTACSNESRTRAPSTSVNVIHAAPSVGSFNFLRVERVEGTLPYAASGIYSWDSDTYTFNVDERRPLGVERVHSFTATLVAGNDYVFVLGEVGGELREIVVEVPREEASQTESQALFVHSASTLGPVDLYLEPPGTDLVAATPRGTLDFRDDLAPFGVPPADYEISLTAVGNPAIVLLASQVFGLAPGVGSFFTILDGGNVGLAPYAVLATGGGGDLLLVDSNLQAGIRAINAMTSGGALDVTIDSNFSPALLPAVQVGVPSAYAFFDAGAHNLTVSPAGNPGVLEIDEEFTGENGTLGTWFLSGDPGALTASFSQDDGRIVAGEAKVAIYNGATSVPSVDVFVVAPGTDLNTIAPSAQPPSGTTTPILVGIGDFEITVRQLATTAVLAGPLPVTIGVERSYGILLTDSVGGATVDITLLDAFN